MRGRDERWNRDKDGCKERRKLISKMVPTYTKSGGNRSRKTWSKFGDQPCHLQHHEENTQWHRLQSLTGVINGCGLSKLRRPPSWVLVESGPRGLPGRGSDHRRHDGQWGSGCGSNWRAQLSIPFYLGTRFLIREGSLISVGL